MCISHRSHGAWLFTLELWRTRSFQVSVPRLSPRPARRGACRPLRERARPLRPPSHALQRDVISHRLGDAPSRSPQQKRLHPPQPGTACTLPLTGGGHCRETRSFLPIRHSYPAPARPSCLPATARSLVSRRPRLQSRAPRTRQTARAGGLVSRRSRRGVLSAGAALLSSAEPSRSQQAFIHPKKRILQQNSLAQHWQCCAKERT